MSKQPKISKGKTIHIYHRLSFEMENN